MNCLYCGKEFDNNRGHTKKGKQKFCCRDCFLSYCRDKRNEPKSYCERCGKPIYEKSHKTGKIKKYCSEECQKRNQSEKAFKYVFCHYCGKTFKETRDITNLYCSKKCYEKAKAEDNMKSRQEEDERKKKLLEEYYDTVGEAKKMLARAEAIRHEIDCGKNCAVCGQYFVGRSPLQVCCGEECSRKNTNRKKDKRIYKNGKPDLSITLTKLYLRDEGVCQICGRKIEFDCDPNSDYYPSIDHVKPLSKGGLHQWDNVQLACRKCNTEKGNHAPL